MRARMWSREKRESPFTVKTVFRPAKLFANGQTGTLLQNYP
jgi:hypothetical protein